MRLRALAPIPENTGTIDVGTKFEAGEQHGQWLIDRKMAVRMPEPDLGPSAAAIGRLKGKTVVCIASGPSLNVEDCEFVRDWRTLTSGNVIVVNSSYQRAPWADVLYSGDFNWWADNGPPPGDHWTRDERAHLEFGVNYAPGLSGPNSGHQALDLATWWGASRIILLAYDMMSDKGRQQWHAPHENGVTSQPYHEWIAAMNVYAETLNTTVVNCSRRTALRCFPRVALQDELARSELAA